MELVYVNFIILYSIISLIGLYWKEKKLKYTGSLHENPLKNYLIDFYFYRKIQ